MIKNQNVLLIAHRGESYLAPENTLSAINLAWQNGAKAVEIDIRLTLDSEIVVIHDKSTKRLGDLNLRVSKSLLKDLKEVDVGMFKNEKWKDERIPTLVEILHTIPADGKLIIEIKSGPEIITPLYNLLKEFVTIQAQIEIISFNRKVLTEIKKKLPHVKMLWLLNLDYYTPNWMTFSNTKSIIRKISDSNLDGINVWAGKIINKEFIKQFHELNLVVYTWTINDSKKAAELMRIGVDAIATDRAAWLTSQ